MKKLLTLIDHFLEQEKLASHYYDQKEEAKKILKEIENGLLKQPSGSSLPMLDTRISTEIKIPLEEESRIVIDAGGTHLRIAEVIFNQQIPKILDLKSYSIPGSKGKTTKSDFLNFLVDQLRKIIKNHTCIYFCFSYPTRFNPKGEAVVISLSKEVEIDGLINTPICSGLIDKLHQRGFFQIKKIIVLNDTTATLLAGKLSARLQKKKYFCYLGTVLGTGFNLSYEENDLSTNPFIVNTESGFYDGWTMSEFDQRLDQTSISPGKHITEKKLSGHYLGNNFLASIKLAIEKKYFSSLPTFRSFETRSNAERFIKISHFPTSDLTLLLDQPEEFSQKYLLLEDGKQFITILQKIAQAHVTRSSIIISTMVSSFALRSFGIDQKCTDYFLTRKSRYSSNPQILFNFDGSLLKSMHSLNQKIQSNLHSILSEWNISFDSIFMDQSPILGSSVATYLSSKV